MVEILEVATTLAKQVGERIRATLGSDVQVTHKGVRDLVTEIDQWSEDQITRGILERFPSHRIVGEETNAIALAELEQAVQHGTTWIIDPIDGTTNFVSGIPQVGVSLGVLVEGKRTVGVIYDPIRDELFTAVRGEGAKKNGHPIRVGSKAALIDGVIATGFPYERQHTWEQHRKLFEPVLLQCRDIRSFGAATLDQCWVACGRLDGFFEENLKPWDVAAGSLIVEEAGGVIGHCIESTEQFSLTASSFLFANRPLYHELKTIFTHAYER